MPSPVKVLILHFHKENPRKCSAEALRGRPDVEMRVVRPGAGGNYPPTDLAGGILLAVGAPTLSREDRAILDEDTGRRLVIIDANWVKVPIVLRTLAPRGPLVRRTLPREIVTAYPRKSKVREDPAGGLATVEAVAAALAILGAPDPTVLDGYRWAEEFVGKNAWLFGGGAPVRA
jgi:pre-rRNA-processing protein TSR3